MPLSETLFIIMGLLTVAMIAAGIERRLPIPYTVLLVIIGFLLSLLSSSVPALEGLNEIQLTPELVLFVFLPTLIFESAFNLDARKLIQELLPVLTLAIPALLISTMIVGFGTWWLLDISLIVALLFGALISATDRVAVVALFKELGAPQRLTVLVEGESLFNDATAIVLFHILLGFALSGTAQWSDIPLAVVEFIWVFFGGIFIGLLIGLIISKLMNFFDLPGSALMILSLIMAYTSFIVAEHYLHVSGVMAVLTAALCLGYYGVSRLSKSDATLLKETWKFLALAINSLLFLMVGLSVDGSLLLANLDAILIAASIVLVARAVIVYPLFPIATRFFSLPNVSMEERHIMWWGGLKGGLALAIVLSIPFELPERDFLVYLTLGVVLFSLLISTSTIRPLMARLGMSDLEKGEQMELQRGLANSEENIKQLLLQFSEAGLLSQQALQEISHYYHEFLGFSATEDNEAEYDVRHFFLDALRFEFEELNELNDIGILPAYVYLDLRNSLQRDREYWVNWIPGSSVMPVDQQEDIFSRIERAILSRLREHDWAAGFLSWYQSQRLEQRLHHDIASVLMCERVLSYLEKGDEKFRSEKENAVNLYKDRLTRRRKRLADVEAEFPGFFHRFQMRLFERSSLLSASKHLEKAHNRGQIGAKAMTHIRNQLESALNALPEKSYAVRQLNTAELIHAVPLFSDLSESVLDKLAQHVKQVVYLENDVVISEAENGDAMYILIHGRVQVSRLNSEGVQRNVAVLNVGDFFGETAMLGNHVRTATVKAMGPLTLLRLRERDVIKLIEGDKEVADQLHQVLDARRRDN